jgi:hypothetical protein
MQSVASHMRTNSKDHRSSSKPPTHQRDVSALELDDDLASPSPCIMGEVPLKERSHGVPFSTGQEKQRRQAKMSGGLAAINEGSLGDAPNSSTSQTAKLKRVQNPAAAIDPFSVENMLV